MAGNLDAIFNLAGTRLYTLVAYLGFCSVSGKSDGTYLVTQRPLRAHFCGAVP